VNKKSLAAKIKEKFGLPTDAALEIVTEVLKEVDSTQQKKPLSSNQEILNKLAKVIIRGPFEKVGWAYEMLKQNKLTEREILMWINACQNNEGSKDPTHYEGLEKQQMKDLWQKILK